MIPSDGKQRADGSQNGESPQGRVVPQGKIEPEEDGAEEERGGMRHGGVEVHVERKRRSQPHTDNAKDDSRSGVPQPSSQEVDEEKTQNGINE